MQKYRRLTNFKNKFAIIVTFINFVRTYKKQNLKVMEKELSFEEARELVNSFVELNEAKYSKSYVIGMLQAHLTMCLTGVDKEDIIRQLTKNIKESDGRSMVTT